MADGVSLFSPLAAGWDVGTHPHVLRWQERIRLGRHPQPSAGRWTASRSRRRVWVACGARMAAKKLVGRKRHVLVDTEGLLQAVNVHAADIMDRDGIKLVLSEAVRGQLPRMQLLWLDAGDNGRGKGKDWVEQTTGWRSRRLKASIGANSIGCPTSLPPDQIDWSLYVPPARAFMSSQSLGGRADLRLVVAEPPVEQGLRAALRHQRGVDLSRHDPSHAPPPRSLVRGFSDRFSLLEHPLKERNPCIIQPIWSGNDLQPIELLAAGHRSPLRMARRI